jgi:hypothetical protein
MTENLRQVHQQPLNDSATDIGRQPRSSSRAPGAEYSQSFLPMANVSHYPTHQQMMIPPPYENFHHQNHPRPEFAVISSPGKSHPLPLTSEICPIDSQLHSFERDFTCCGIAWAICCFPCGLICLFTMKQKACVKCKRRL